VTPGLSQNVTTERTELNILPSSPPRRREAGNLPRRQGVSA